jgi:hypothetical protein
MQLLYNSESYVVVQFELPNAQANAQANPQANAQADARSGYEIVDKFARKEIFIEGALAERFKQGVQSLVDNGPTEDQLDEFIGSFTESAQQPVVLH